MNKEKPINELFYFLFSVDGIFYSLYMFVHKE